MRGAALVGTEAAEVDDPPDPGLGGGRGEARRRHLLAGGVVGAAAEHVDEEVGDVDPRHRGAQIDVRAEVGLDQLDVEAEDAPRPDEIPDEPANPDPVGAQRADEAPADHAGRAGDQIRRAIAGAAGDAGDAVRPLTLARPPRSPA